VEFTEKRYTKNSVNIGFKIIKKPTIVIDPGHGGKDSGAVSISGNFEKNIVLIMAIELRNMLVDSGRYKVCLTRDGDQDVSLEERLRRIDLFNADFLISIHTDSNKNKDVRGMSIYTLPAIDNSGKPISVLGDSSEKYYQNLAMSRRFANILIGYTPNICCIKNHICRDSNLKVLRINKPAVLIECGHTSNKTDDVLLHSKAFRKKANRAILYSLDEFFKSEVK
jgi:N-acetylmuramoyl-L-alanine amidase